MTTYRFVEEQALIAALEKDDDRLLQIVDGLLPGERRLLADAAVRVALFADDASRCPGCHRPVTNIDDAVTRQARRSNPVDMTHLETWHLACADAPKARRNRRLSIARAWFHDHICMSGDACSPGDSDHARRTQHKAAVAAVDGTRPLAEVVHDVLCISTCPRRTEHAEALHPYTQQLRAALDAP